MTAAFLTFLLDKRATLTVRPYKLRFVAIVRWPRRGQKPAAQRASGETFADALNDLEKLLADHGLVQL